MTAKTHHILLDEEFELHDTRPQVKWWNRTFLRVCLLVLAALAAMILSAAYYGLIFETEGVIYRNSNPTEVRYETQGAIDRSQGTSFAIKHIEKRQASSIHRRRVVSRRKRDASNVALSPLETDFVDLRAKVRDKRTQIELSKLEKEYVKCKKEALDRSECMETFRKMYKIAMDISEKMEKMKDILRDSEMQLKHPESMKKFLNIDKEVSPESSSSDESSCAEDCSFMDFLKKKVKIINVDAENFSTESNNSSTSSQTGPTTEAYSTQPFTTMSTAKGKSQTMATEGPGAFSHSTEFNKSTTITENVTEGLRTSTEPPVAFKSTTRQHNSSFFDSTTEGMETERTNQGNESASEVTEESLDSSSTVASETTQMNLSSSKSLDSHSTTEGLSVEIDIILEPEIMQKSSTTNGFLEIIIERLSEQNATTEGVFDSNSITDFSTLTLDESTPLTSFNDTIEEWDMETDSIVVSDATTHLSSTTDPLTTTSTDFTAKSSVSMEATTEAVHHGQRSFETKNSRPNFKTTITNHTSDVEITYRGKCGATNFEYKTPSEDCRLSPKDPDPETPSQIEAKDLPDEALVKEKDQDHPLDFPSSRENMVDEQFVKQMNQSTTTDSASELQDEWKKIFEDAAADHIETKESATELMDSFGEFDQISIDKFGPKMNPSNSSHGEENHQLMTLCEHLARQFRNKVTRVPEKKEDITPSPNVQFTSRGPGFPVTGETMKASAQFLINPNFGAPSIPVCFYITPASFRMMMQPFWSPFFGMQGMVGGNGGNSAGSSGGIFIIPPSFGNMHNNGNFFGHSSPTGSGSQGNIANIFSKSASPPVQDQKQQQFFCTYMQNLDKHTPSGGFSNANFKLRNSSGNNSSPIDTIYSSYWSKMPHAYGANLGQEDRFQCPLEGDVPCYGGQECVPEKKWCDSIVDCSDGSDEAACTCRSRLPSERLCDGYQDCPLGEDEIGCFGCDKFMYSCYDNTEEFERANRSTLAMCYSSTERCDGIKNCINGRDELGCNLIVNDLTHHMSHAASSSVGFLYRNHQGVWYPVCNNALKWAREACTEELGGLATDPLVTFQEAELPGPFIEPHHMGEAHFPQSCQKRDRDMLTDHVAHVRCPLPKCGIVQENMSPLMRSRRRRRSSVDVEKGRIVGGSFSRPLQWPFIAALYRNGEFHCGGTIFNEQWIITAAHCAIGFQKYFFEVRAGMLRRSSFASSTQIYHVTHVVVHQEYERRTMKNDIALLRIDRPLRYNRWVKPVCLPDKGRTTMGDDWIWGPEVDTVCTVVGWGAVREKGPGSDSLREVHLPIRKRCTEKDDQEAEDICAGEATGGRDACQGDSGGPLFCRSVSNNKEWYLAGVVSHGNGCARVSEFGVYTRVALYLDWIEMATRAEYLPKAQPRQLCPGFVCVWGGKRCVSSVKRCDRIVDCLGGEDEVGCIYNSIPDVGAPLNVSTSATTLLTEGVTSTTEIPNAGGDTDPSSLEFPDGSQSTSTNEETTATSVRTTPELVSPAGKLFGWMEDDETAMPSSTETIPTTTDGTSEVVTSEKPTLPTSTMEIEKLKDLAVKFLETSKEATTESSTVETTTLTTQQMPRTTPAISSTTSTEGTSVSGFGDFKADLTDFSSASTPTSVHKRENATEDAPAIIQPKTMPKKVSNKFVCTKIPQIIDISNRCDRVPDCEDGSDEEGCTCRQYLKGPLNLLICDGKVDCEDLTDEDDCGNCTATEFLCPMSNMCIDVKKRCDNFVDCQFNEDEKDCFALTNGKEIHLDATKQASLQSAGIFSRNLHGVWRVVCSYETGFHIHSAKTAAEICSLLGFKGYKDYNTKNITHHTIVPIEPFLKAAYGQDSHAVGDAVHFTDGIKHPSHITLESSRTTPIEKIPDNCLGIFVECVPKANGSAPLKTISAGDEISPKILNVHGHKPSADKEKNELFNKLQQLIETSKSVLVHDKLHVGVERWHWPWMVDVYTNGMLRCVGVLVDKHWVLVHESCYGGVRLDEDYVTVLLGGGKSKHAPHRNPHEQIKRVDCFKSVIGSNVLLLHLEYAAHFTRHILPTFLPDVLLAEKENEKPAGKAKLECMSVVHDKFGGTKVTPTVGLSVETEQQPYNNASDTVCGDYNEPSYYRWNPSAILHFKAKHMGDEEAVASGNPEEDAKSLSDFCEDLDSSTNEISKQGIIVCREDSSGWYPAAFHAFNSSECNNFEQPFPVRTLKTCYRPIENIIDQAHCEDSYRRPLCLTLRCPLGNCLLPEQMCNGKVDCHDGSDEEKEFCRLHKNECRTTEFKCRSNGKCVPKTKFCDHIADCEDLTDEPTICSCFTYLQATDPGKICDGIRNCWDKSDESPVLCNCTSNRFPCGSSPTECIPKDFVCDKEIDCPNGEDEEFCYGIEHPITSTDGSAESPHRPGLPLGYGQVMEQTYGVWHTKCFPRKHPPNAAEVADICRKLGYRSSKQPSYRLIDDSLDIVVASRADDVFTELPRKYRDATKALVINKFSPLHLNNDLTLIMKPSRPITELVKWNETDSSNCYRLEIKCG